MDQPAIARAGGGIASTVTATRAAAHGELQAAVARRLPAVFYTLRERQLPPVEACRRHGVPMALATDCNPGSSPVISLRAILNMGCTLFGA